jgi:hypothetical protein
MTKIEFNLPDALAKEAQGAGLLQDARLEELIREQLRKDAYDRLLVVMKAAHAVSGPEMSMDEINAEVKAVRRERREREAAGR